ncbi:hypothetical protein D9M68_706950 [compost metagenome]
MDGPTVKPGNPASTPRPLEEQTRRWTPPAESAATCHVMEEPVVGWLVVIAGPGKGASRSLSYGVNTVGRGADQAVVLDFGDDGISRSHHLGIVYDARNRTFYAQPGTGRSLSYVGEQPLLTPVALSGSVDLTLGNTTLRFVPFCGPDFDWGDGSGPKSAS